MLILTRRIGEAIIVDHQIKITIKGQDKNGNIALGIDAPRHIAINREEIEKKLIGGLDDCSGNMRDADGNYFPDSGEPDGNI